MTAISLKTLSSMFSTLKSTDISNEKKYRQYSRMAKKGDAQAQCELGLMYYAGTGVVKNLEEAVKWYRKSAEQGFPEGQNRIGLMYEKGICVAKDPELAIQWFRKSAEQGFCTAQYNLARMYENQQDYVLAKMWSIIANECGLQHVVEMGKSLSKKMTNEQIQEARRMADQWLQEH